MNFSRRILFALVLVGCSTHLAFADVISINFNNTTDANWTLQSGDAAGPLGSLNWNNTSTASGSGQILNDDSGSATLAAITWSSANTWTNGDNNGNNDRILLHPYLDDGGGGVAVTITNIPYAEYRVYGIVSSDQNGNNASFTTGDFVVNGSAVLGGNATAAGDYDYAVNNFGGSVWRELTTSQEGNYWLTGTQTAGTLVVDGPARAGSVRGSLSGLIIEEINSVPEPGTLAMFGFAGIGLVIRRKR